MISLVEALQYRCLKYSSQKLEKFHILVGPNGSGKSTFLDVITFIRDIVSEGPTRAIQKRAPCHRDMIWLREGSTVELAIESEIPDKVREKLSRKGDTICRYEISLSEDSKTGLFGLFGETLWLKPREIVRFKQPSLYLSSTQLPDSLMTRGVHRNWKKIINKIKGGNDNFYAETKGFDHAFKLGFQKSALGNLPEDEEKFPVAMWFRHFLQEEIHILSLRGEFLRESSPPRLSRGFLPDGSNLPWVINDLYIKDERKFDKWIAHIQKALPDIETIKTLERPQDRHRYLVICYRNGLEVPSWLVSKGTLRMLALTLLAYLPEVYGTYLIEEPEAGIHPGAVETVFQSLSSINNAQILFSTHSSVILNAATPHNLLCFARADDGATDIITGTLQPDLKEWKDETSLDALCAKGILG
ncbi:MAG: ATP-binding protein [Thermodesulfobacteriota bacterium]|nr:ATP-binding protein [Thermodesulfobacteriota bacterium]